VYTIGPAVAERRRVALYGHRLAATGTGIARYVDELTVALAALEPADIAYELGGSREPSSAAPPAAALPVRRPPLPRALLHSSWSIAHRPKVDRWLANPALVHVLYPSSPVPARAPLVCTVHDLMPLLHPAWYGRSEVHRFNRGVRYFADHARYLIADSAKTQDEVVERLGVDRERVPVVHLGISSLFLEPADPVRVRATCEAHGVTPGAYLLMLGAVSVRKNAETVLRALARSRAVERGLVLVLAGPPGAGIEQVTNAISALQLDESVVRTGWLPATDIRDLVAGALALVHPSVDEGFGLTPLEAMAQGVPALVSSAGSLPEVCGDAAMFIDPADPDAWAAAIDRLLTDPDLRAGLIARGNNHHRSFTWRRTAEQTLAVHRRALTP
jgi:glycosyltransferase involved in cell wall biosynthesis